MKKTCIKYLFAAFCLFALFDFFLLILSNEYRNFFGEVRKASEVIWRVAIDVVMVLFYGILYRKATIGTFMPRVMVWHGVLYCLLGFAMCLPWVGYLLAPFSPISLLYLGSILWAFSWGLSLTITIVFIVSNIYLAWFGLTTR
jgi:hypothetical protein